MKSRSIYQLNSQIRNYLYLVITIFIISSTLFSALFFWSLANEVDGKAETWTRYFTERISFLETIVQSRTTIDHGIDSVIKIMPDGEVINTRPFPSKITHIGRTDLYKQIKDYPPGTVKLIKQDHYESCEKQSLYLILRRDNSFSIATLPADSLLPVQPSDTELFIKDSSGNCVFHTEDKFALKNRPVNIFMFSKFRVFTGGKASTDKFGGFNLYIAKDISTEFYAGALLLSLTCICLAILLNRSSFLTWDLHKNEQDFGRIEKLLSRVSSTPDEDMSHLPAVEFMAENIRKVDWQKEISDMTFSENINYIKATAFFSKNILQLLDKISAHSKELADSRQQYRDLVQVARSIIIRLDTNGVCTFFNEYAQNFFGLKLEEILGKNVLGTIVPTSETGDSPLEIHIATLLKSPESIPTHTNKNICKDGRTVSIFWSNTPIYDANGNLVEILSVGTDVTEKALAEEELTKTRQYLKNIIDSMPSAIIGINNHGEITHFNSVAQEMAKVPVAEIEGTSFEIAFPSVQGYYDHIFRAIETGVPETGIRSKDTVDPLKYQDIMIYPLGDDMEGAVVRIDDSTERVRIQEMMIQTEKMMSVGGLAAGMAHEINNPLGGILQGIQNIIRRFSPDLPANIKAAENSGCSLESILEYMEDRKIIKTLDGITDSGMRAANIVSGMLEFSRKSDSQKAPGNLKKMMDKAESLAMQDYDLKKKYDFKKINITKDYDENLYLAKCSETEIEQVFLNLLRNAAQAMAHWEKMDREPQIHIVIKNHRNSIQCSITDNGPGMNEKTSKRVFEPFYTTKDPGSGTGLGLSVSYFIITQNHNGKFHVHSTPGVGTTFVVTLPAMKIKV